jgi:hypothetical protein
VQLLQDTSSLKAPGVVKKITSHDPTVIPTQLSFCSIAKKDGIKPSSFSEQGEDFHLFLSRNHMASLSKEKNPNVHQSGNTVDYRK